MADCICEGRPHYDECVCPSCCADKLRVWLKEAEVRAERAETALREIEERVQRGVQHGLSIGAVIEIDGILRAALSPRQPHDKEAEGDDEQGDFGAKLRKNPHPSAPNDLSPKQRG